jgi:hypothetical protein
VAGDLADGERGDTARGLAVEQDEAADGPVDGIEGVVAEEPGGQFPAAVAGDSGPVPALRARDIEAGAVPAAGGPGQEVADVAGGVQSQPCSSAVRAAWARLRAPVLAIAEDR